MTIRMLVSLILAVAACSAPAPVPQVSTAGGETVLQETPTGRPSLLAFTKTRGFRHESIPVGLETLAAIAQELRVGLVATEDAQTFTDASLSRFAAVVFLNTTGDVLDDGEQAAFERYVGAGGGYVGVHAAADCEYDWPFYGQLVGAYFAGHRLVAPATVNREPVDHPALIGISDPWTRTDEWYGFRTNPRASSTILLTVDETSFDPGPGAMGADHPIAWSHSTQNSRAFYTAMGHTVESYRDPTFVSHLRGGLIWAAQITTVP